MKTTTHTEGFELNGKTYRTDAATLGHVRAAVALAKDHGERDALALVMFAGIKFGAIVEA